VVVAADSRQIERVGSAHSDDAVAALRQVAAKRIGPASASLISACARGLEPVS
jgi:hypothetical protein